MSEKYFVYASQCELLCALSFHMFLCQQREAVDILVLSKAETVCCFPHDSRSEIRALNVCTGLHQRHPSSLTSCLQHQLRDVVNGVV